MIKWIIGIGVIVLVIIVFREEIFANAKWGGMVYGKSHEEGGQKAFVKDKGALIEVESGETILNKVSMKITDQYMCQGTPKQIASKLNELGGGVLFEEGGNCIKIA